MKQIRKANWFLLFVICVFVGGSFGLAWLFKRVDVSYNLSVMSGQILIGFCLLIYLIITKTNPIKAFRSRRLGIVDILLVALLMFLMLPMVYFINYISMFFTENTTAATIGGMVDNPYLLNLLMLAVTPAIVEELVCRGVLFHAYKKRSLLWAVLLTAFIFGLLHMNLNQMLYAGVIGIAFAVAVEATGSIYSSMIMHFIMNSISVTALAFLKFVKNLGLYPEEMFEMDMQQVQAGTELAVSPVVTVVLVLVAFMVVVASTALAVGVIILLAKRSGRTENLKELFRKNPKAKRRNLQQLKAQLEEIGETTATEEEMTTEPAVETEAVCKDDERIMDLPFKLAVVIALIVMIWL